MEAREKKRTWTEEERARLATTLDRELDDYISGLEKKTYSEGWAEDNWQEEMEKHPFFMTKPPEPGEQISPLMEGLQQLKYGEDENTPEELANNYKEDGNFNFKYKRYRLAILSYTQGIRIKCKDDELMAQLYNNRAAANFMLQNYRSCLNDCKLALKLKPGYTKSLHRAAVCSLHIKDYDQCIDLCKQFLAEDSTDAAVLKLKSNAVLAKESMRRDQRKQKRLEKKNEKKNETLLEAIIKRGINLEQMSNKRKIEFKDLQPEVPEIAQCAVHFDKRNKLVWPVVILYPAAQQADFVQNFHEDTQIAEQLIEILQQPPEWDVEHQYTVSNVNVYFEGKNRHSVHKVNLEHTLGEVLQNERFVIRHGTPAFLLFVKGSEAEKCFLDNY